MTTQPQSGRGEPGIPVPIDAILDALLTEHLVGRRRAAHAQVIEARPCDGCGGAGHDVDLWAEDSETGEQLWLCMSCGES